MKCHGRLCFVEPFPAMSIFNAVPVPVTAPISVALNHLLRQEKWARDKLIVHAGKVACFTAGTLSLQMRIDADGLVSTAAPDESVAVKITVRAADLPLILQNPGAAFSKVRIEGDADFANTISQVAKGVRWDVAGDLAKVVGDVAAERLVKGAVSGAVSLKQIVQKFMENTAEYLLEEKPMLVRPAGVADFTDEVTRLRDDIERLAKRIERLT